MTSENRADPPEDVQDIFRGIVQDVNLPVIEEEILLEIDSSFGQKRDDGLRRNEIGCEFLTTVRDNF